MASTSRLISMGIEIAETAKMANAMAPPITVPVTKRLSPCQEKRRVGTKSSSGGQPVVPKNRAKSRVATRTQISRAPIRMTPMKANCTGERVETTAAAARETGSPVSSRRETS